MKAEEYLDYLIMTARSNTSITVQPSELELLRTLIKAEKIATTPVAVNRNGNPL